MAFKGRGGRTPSYDEAAGQCDRLSATAQLVWNRKGDVLLRFFMPHSSMPKLVPVRAGRPHEQACFAG